MTANEKATRLYNENYNLILDYDNHLSKKNIVNILTIKLAKITCNEILKAISPVDYEQRKYYKDVLVELDKM